MSFESSEHKRRVAATYNLASAGYDQESVRFFPLCARRLVELIGPPSVWLAIAGHFS